MQIIFALILVVTLASSVSRGVTGKSVAASVSGRTRILLYDWKKRDSFVHEGDLLPNRLYVKWEDSWQKWVFVLTDEQGKFPIPTAALLEGTVLPGPSLGGPANRNFILTAKGKWLSTSEGQRHWLRVLGSPVRLRVVKFQDPVRSAKNEKRKPAGK